MTQTRVLWAVACGLLLVSGCGKAEFKEFASADGRFKVQMPGTPKEETQTAAGVTMKTYSLQEKNEAYAVAFADLPIPAGSQRLRFKRGSTEHATGWFATSVQRLRVLPKSP